MLHIIKSISPKASLKNLSAQLAILIKNGGWFFLLGGGGGGGSGKFVGRRVVAVFFRPGRRNGEAFHTSNFIRKCSTFFSHLNFQPFPHYPKYRLLNVNILNLGIFVWCVCHLKDVEIEYFNGHVE